jgi:2-dehydro-3-deoxygluconokinase
MLGNEEDFTAALGYKVEGLDKDISKLDTSAFKNMIQRVVEAYPNFKAVATTLRNAKTACVNDWGAVLFYDGKFYEAMLRENLEIYDRAVNYGAAHGALAMTTPGDTTMASLAEVEKAMKSATARVDR